MDRAVQYYQPKSLMLRLFVNLLDQHNRSLLRTASIPLRILAWHTSFDVTLVLASVFIGSL
jgi:hypothetical protein